MESMLSGAAAPTPAEAAEGAIRDYCGWHVAPVIRETVTLDGTGRSLLKLPSMRVVEVHSVLVDGTDVTSMVRWSDMGMLEGIRFPDRFRAVVVEMTHGFDPEDVPGVIGVLLRAAKRFSTDPTIRSQAIAGASVSYAAQGRTGAPLSHLLTMDEQAALEPYRLVRGA